MRTLCRLVRRRKGKMAKVAVVEEEGVKPQPQLGPPRPRVVEIPDVWANAPKRQPCPECRRWIKRISRSDTVAKYYCRKCNIEMIVSLRKKKRVWRWRRE